VIWWWVGMGAAFVAALVVLGFAVYEATWKFTRLTDDVDGLAQVTVQLKRAQADLTALSERLQAVTARER
jgi:Tfp pilus assembly protein PilN